MNLVLSLSSMAMLHFVVPFAFSGTAWRWWSKQTAAAIDRAVKLCTGQWILCCRMTGTLKNWAGNFIWGGSVCPHFLSTWTEPALYIVDVQSTMVVFYHFIQSLTHSLSHHSQLHSHTQLYTLALIVKGFSRWTMVQNGFLFARLYVWT